MASPNTESFNLVDAARRWGENAVPATGLAALLSALHTSTSRRHDRTSTSATVTGPVGRVMRAVPMFVLVPALLGSSYLNLAGFKTDAAGLSAAASISYMAMAMRRQQTIRNKFTIRGLVRASALALCATNITTGLYVFATGADGENDDDDETV